MTSTLLKALPKKATMYLTILNSFFATYQEIGYTNRILQPEQKFLDVADTAYQVTNKDIPPVTI